MACPRLRHGQDTSDSKVPSEHVLRCCVSFSPSCQKVGDKNKRLLTGVWKPKIKAISPKPVCFY